MMRQAQAMQKKVADAQKRLEDMEIEGISGGGMVSVTLQGNMRVSHISINPALMIDEVDVLEDLIIAAFNDAWEKIEQKKSEEMGSVMEGQKLPFGLI